MLRILGTAFAAMVGLAFGSFLNVCLSRWPAGESIVAPGSHCRNCDHSLAWWENIPLLSWIALRGRCRNCGTPISWRYPLVELVVGALWAYIAWEAFPKATSESLPTPMLWYGITAAILQMIFLWMLVALALLDLENFWLPDFLTLCGTAIGLLYSFAEPFVLWELDSTSGLPLTEGFGTSRFALWEPGIARVGSSIAAAGLILLIRWVYWLFRRQEGIGLGDAKLMAMLAAWMGLPGALLAFALGVVLGAAVAAVLLAVPKPPAQSRSWALAKLPLGTFLCIGGVVSSLWGNSILAGYLRWAGF